MLDVARALTDHGRDHLLASCAACSIHCADELNATEPSCEPVVVPPPVVLPADTVPPDTAITKKPSGGGSEVKIEFTADEPGSTFSCKLDKAPFRSCSSPKKLKGLAPGKHKFKVRAADRVGNTDPTPAKVRFNVAG